MRETGAARFGHRLVLVGGADHFSLRRVGVMLDWPWSAP